MKKRFPFIVATVLLSLPVFAQQVTVFRMGGAGDGFGGMNVGEQVDQKKIGEATLECTYDYRFVTDTLDRETKHRQDVMILQAGGGVSKFYSYLSFRADSLARSAGSAQEIMANIDRYRGGESWVLFKNYPAGKFSLTDKVGRDRFLCEDDYRPQEWEISGETQEIEGYACQKAACDFNGRRWIAWLSPEVPLHEGPWKLNGLPGLIMQAYDIDGDHCFTLTGLRQVSAVPVTMANHQYLKTSRKNYLKTLRKFREDPIGMMSQSGVNIKIMKEDGTTPNPEAMAPRTMHYDFLETDYR